MSPFLQTTRVPGSEVGVEGNRKEKIQHKDHLG